MTEAELQALEQRAHAATAGPWQADDEVAMWSNGDTEGAHVRYEREPCLWSPVAMCKLHGGGRWGHGGSDRPLANARYIAAANPAVVLRLLAELATLRADNARLDAEREAAELVLGRVRKLQMLWQAYGKQVTADPSFAAFSRQLLTVLEQVTAAPAARDGAEQVQAWDEKQDARVAARLDSADEARAEVERDEP